jgi:predicted DNA-binding transcriptional regulator YafY
LLSGRWYLVGLDSIHAQTRIFCLNRIRALQSSGKKGAFQVPADFRIQDWISLPFEIEAANQKDAPPPDTSAAKTPASDAYRQALLLIPATRSAQAERLTQGHGQLTPREDGGLNWSVSYCNTEELLRFAFTHHLGFLSEYERRLANEALRSILQAHGGQL